MKRYEFSLNIDDEQSLSFPSPSNMKRKKKNSATGIIAVENLDAFFSRLAPQPFPLALLFRFSTRALFSLYP